MTARLLEDSKEQNMIHQTINPKISFDRESKKCNCWVGIYSIKLVYEN
jgi:hypothetical protein